jgi:hypothetical protein
VARRRDVTDDGDLGRRDVAVDFIELERVGFATRPFAKARRLAARAFRSAFCCAFVFVIL